jgi:hypothetical protein
MLKKLAVFVLSVSGLTLSINSASWAGVGSSGGGDQALPQTDSAWFLGTRTIRYCLVGGEKEMGLPQDQLRRSVEEAFAKWSAYIEYKGVSRHEDPRMVIDLNHSVMNQCDGTEDLKFYFGVEDAQVSRSKTTYDAPLAFAHRTRYDVDTGWGHGYIWMASPNALETSYLLTPDMLSGLLLHELGHVLGNSHVPSTIMDENIVDNLRFGAMGPDGVGHALQIDWGAELAENRYHHPLVGKLSANPKNQETASNFKRMTGRNPVGDARVTLLLGAQGWHGPLDLVFEDAVGKSSVKVEYDDETYTRIRLPNAVFKRACLPSICSGWIGQRLEGAYGIGSVNASDGMVLSALLEFNLGRSGLQVDAPVQIKFLENGKKHDIFAQTLMQ